jgi:hypothetical protein
MIDRGAVSAALRAVGLEVLTTEDEDGWSASFDVEGESRKVMLFVDEEQEYFHIGAFPGVRTKLDELPAEKLRELLRVQTGVWLAKVEYYDNEEQGTGFFVATSECSTNGYTGAKLQSRMAACALLARRIRMLLS